MILHRIILTADERAELLAKVQKGKSSAKSFQKANVLLDSDESVGRQSQTQLALTHRLSTRSIERIRKDFCDRGMDVFVPKPRKPRSDKKVTVEVEAPPRWA